LEEDLMGTASQATVPGFPARLNGRAPALGVPRRVRLRPERRRWPITELAVAAVLLLALATAFVANQPPGGGTDDGETRLAAIQGASPTAEAAECTVAPRTEQVIQGEGTPQGLPGTPSIESALSPELTLNPYGILEVEEEQLPEGEAAPQAAVVGIRATIAEAAACAEAGEFERQLALFSDDYFRRPSTVGTGSVGFPPLPEKASMAAEVEVRDARELPDGRVGAVIDSPYASPSFLVFVEQDGRWLIDESVVIFQIYGLDGTPAPEGPGVGASASCGATPGSGTPATAEDIGFSQIVIEDRMVVGAGIVATTDPSFAPGELEVAANLDVNLVLLNCRAEPTGFVIDELSVNLTLQPGETANISVNAAPGTYEYYSDLPGQREAGLVGTLRVVDQGTPSPCVPAEEFDPDEDVCYEVPD
jgi:hypothetical protein